jgi:hypothetical protein
MGVSNDADAHKDTVDPEAWAIVDGKLYLTHNQYWLGYGGNTPRNTSSWLMPVGKPSRTRQNPPS